VSYEIAEQTLRALTRVIEVQTSYQSELSEDVRRFLVRRGQLLEVVEVHEFRQRNIKRGVALTRVASLHLGLVTIAPSRTSHAVPVRTSSMRKRVPWLSEGLSQSIRAKTLSVGGGGNIDAVQSTQAACGANISYDYTARPPVQVPEPGTLALLGFNSSLTPFPSKSSPPPPRRVSLPAWPSRASGPLLPVISLSSALPTPAAPASLLSLRCSTLARRTNPGGHHWQ